MSATNIKQSTDAKPTASKRQPREGSVVWAMIQVLDGKRTPMKPAEILEEIQQRGLAKKLAGKTPEASVAARLAVHVGVYFERPEKGKYQLRKGVTAKSVASSGASKPATSTTTKRSGSPKDARKTATPQGSHAAKRTQEPSVRSAPTA